MPENEDCKSRIAIWVAVITTLGAVLVALIPVIHRPAAAGSEKIVLEGMVMRDEANPEKRFPLSSVLVSATDGLAPGQASTTNDGMFRLELKPEARAAGQISLNFKHPDYQEKDVIQVIGKNVQYVFYMWPSQYARTAPGAGVVPVFYAPVVAKTFQVPNRGNVRCGGGGTCSPDGVWKAGMASATIDAGPGKVFATGRADCIAGPCPWSRAETAGFPQIGQRTLTVSIRNWSDTVTYRVWGEIR